MVFCVTWRFETNLSCFKSGKPRTEVVQDDGRRRRYPFQCIRKNRLKKCFVFLNIRQGSILLALVELIMLLFIGMMVIMVLLHVLQIEALIISEVEDSPARESIAHSGLSGQEAIIAEVNNESRLQVGLHLAEYKVVGITVLLLFIVLQIVSTGLLLVGAVTRRRGMLIMWLCTSNTNLFAIVCAMTVAFLQMTVQNKKYLGSSIQAKPFLILGFISSVCLIHNILIVASLYWELSDEKNRVRRTNDVTDNLPIDITTTNWGSTTEYIRRRLDIAFDFDGSKKYDSIIAAEGINERTEHTPEFINERTEYTPVFINERTEHTPELINERTEYTPVFINERTEHTPERNNERTEHSPERAAELTDAIPNTPLIPDLLSDPSCELVPPLQSELKEA